MGAFYTIQFSIRLTWIKPVLGSLRRNRSWQAPAAAASVTATHIHGLDRRSTVMSSNIFKRVSCELTIVFRLTIPH
jgi:hypothetical protein